MYHDKTTEIKDRREMLRVKLKSLAAEAKIIRHEEWRGGRWVTYSKGVGEKSARNLYTPHKRRIAPPGAIREELQRHRVGPVRIEARITHLAYGLIKGRELFQMERNFTGLSEAFIDSIKAMIVKYGPTTTAERAALLSKLDPKGWPQAEAVQAVPIPVIEK